MTVNAKYDETKPEHEEYCDRKDASQHAWDETTGAKLDPDIVRIARKKEIG